MTTCGLQNDNLVYASGADCSSAPGDRLICQKCNARVSYVANVCKGHGQDNLPPEFNFDREITYHLHIVYMLVLAASTTLEKMEI